MIRYALKCADDHSFESWFKSAAAFESLMQAGMVSCPTCAGTEVIKAIMAPQVRPARNAVAPVESPPSLSAPSNPAEQKLAKLKAKIEAESDYVGMSFAKEARAMHDGDVPERSIYGEARPDEAKKLIEDGIPVAPLPFVPGRKTN